MESKLASHRSKSNQIIPLFLHKVLFYSFAYRIVMGKFAYRSIIEITLSRIVI